METNSDEENSELFNLWFRTSILSLQKYKTVLSTRVSNLYPEDSSQLITFDSINNFKKFVRLLNENNLASIFNEIRFEWESDELISDDTLGFRVSE